MKSRKHVFVRDEVRNAVIEECAKAVPTNWCDSLLTGPKAVIHDNGNAIDIERLLLAIAARIRSLKTGQREDAAK